VRCRRLLPQLRLLALVLGREVKDRQPPRPGQAREFPGLARRQVVLTLGVSGVAIKECRLAVQMVHPGREFEYAAVVLGRAPNVRDVGQGFPRCRHDDLLLDLRQLQTAQPDAPAIAHRDPHPGPPGPPGAQQPLDT